jgi:BirA family transcriptional regulator, biotin operon repressor / biotin---[acetyl-CoA-carboxylase] ligase
VPDSLEPGVVKPLLRGRFGRETYIYAETAPSTQRLLGDDAAEGAVAVAEEQTAGRGRLGRSWVAPARTSVLCSVVLRPAVEPGRLPELSLVAGRAVARAIAAGAQLSPRIKFPNDVLVKGRKIAGILAEASEGRVVLGIGVNVLQNEAELPESATSLRLETGKALARAPLLAELLAQLEAGYDAWNVA